MAQRKKILQKLISFFLTLVILMSFCVVPSVADGTEQNAITTTPIDQYDRTSYSEYIKDNAGQPMPALPSYVDLATVTANDAGEYTYTNQYNSQFGLKLGEDVNSVNIPVKVAEGGLYQLELTYYPLDTSDLSLEIMIMIDGELPFTEAGYCNLRRTYVNGEIGIDDEGHDITPYTNQKSRWITNRLMDLSGINGNYYFYFPQGTHNVTLVANDVPFLLSAFSLQPEKETPATYKQYIEKNDKNGAKLVKNHQKKYQAEKLSEKSSSSITPKAERTSVALEPFDYSHSRINVLDGSRWTVAGDWISWDINVPEDGYYNLAFKYRQNYLDGLYSSRDILIDGEVPFAEAQAVHFDYTTKWKMKVFGDDKPYSVYLTEGPHTITMKNVLGDFAETLDVMSSCVTDMNALYLDIIEITGSAPDTNRDYYLQDLIPDISDRFIAISDKLFAEVERLTNIVKLKGAETAVLEDIAFQLKSYASDIDGLTNNDRVSSFNTNIVTLSSKISTLNQQGLDLDYIVVTTSDKEMPKCNPGFFKSLISSIRLFFASFFSTSTTKTDDEVLRIWVAGGQEQLEIVRRMTREQFTVKTGIPVSVELVSGSLQQAALAGNNPDVALNIASDVPVNFALRGALNDLSGYEGFEELKSQYRDGSFTPYTIKNGIYGIPDTETYSMLFVRKDIFEEMGLEIPQTWDDLLDLAPILQRRNMQVGMSAGFGDLVFQNGGRFYNEELTEVCFTDNEDVEAFKTLTEFFTDYGFPIAFDFLTRFRSGEMPIGIAPFNTYNNINYSAPEIDGLWEMYPFLGTEQEDGTINRTCVATPATVSVMFSNTKLEDEAWQFLRWWADAETQTTYGLKLESVMGVAARHATANTITMKQLPWSDSELKSLMQQRETLETLPILPGTYYVTRCYNNAYRAVINLGENPREMLNKWVKPINDELARKQREFDSNNQ